MLNDLYKGSGRNSQEANRNIWRLSWNRDQSALDSALARPFQTFDGEELYSTPVGKAASLIESILMNHPCIDGNKRTGYVLMRILLINHGFDIKASQEEKYKFVLAIATGHIKLPEIIDWLNIHCIKTTV